MVASLCLSILFGVLIQVQHSQPGSRDVALERFEFRETHMGSEFKLLIYTSDETAAKEASRAVFDRVAELDRRLSDYQADSELNLLCDQAGGRPFPVSDDLYRVLEASLAMSMRTQGKFDPTVRPVVRLWRRAFRQKRLPDPVDLAAARELVGHGLVQLDPAARTVLLEKPGMRLDLGGIAKGFACDEAQHVLAGRGVDRALVAAAGDIVVSGPPPGEAAWIVGIGPLDDPSARPENFIELLHSAVSTSGDTERFVEIDGIRYAHIVDPSTGLGVVQRASVTVVARDGTTADSLATSIYLLGPDRGLRLALDFPGTEVLFIRRDADTLSTWKSPGWPTSAPRPPVPPERCKE